MCQVDGRSGQDALCPGEIRRRRIYLAQPIDRQLELRYAVIEKRYLSPQESPVTI
jgi:hypothetical protein